MNPIRILIADDHPVVQEGLLQLLDGEPGMEVAGVAGNGREALEKIGQLEPDVILLDLNMPEMSGFDAARLIGEQYPQVKIVAFSMHSEEAFVHRVFSAGATGYVLKGAPVEEITDAIRQVLAGNYYLCPKIRGGVIKSFLRHREEDVIQANYDLLSEREQQVFRLVVEGKSTNRIGQILCVSPKTVEKHRLNIMRKLEVNSLIDMVKYAVRIGIIDPELWKD